MTRSRMRPIRDTISLAEARTVTGEAATPLDRVERVSLASAGGRVLASDVVAHADVPPFSRAGMDGYAVRAADTAGATRGEPCVLESIERVFTGQMPTRRVEAGTCMEIATGAPMPEGADAVVMVEDTDMTSTNPVRIFVPVQPQQNVGRQGADIQRGQTVLTAGLVLNASRVGAIAALGTGAIEVYARPRVAILSTGDEIVDPGVPLAPGHLYDINRFSLGVLVEEHGGVAVPYRTAADTLDDLSRALDDCLREDILVFSGGSSAGERDLVLDALSSRGTVLFHGIAIKPGKPTSFGRVEGKPFFGLPGYPTSCLSQAYILLVPFLRTLARLPPLTIRKTMLPLAHRVVSAQGRHQFYTVRVVNGTAVPAFKASGDITSMSKADGYFEIAADVESVEQGEMVEVTLW